MASPSTRNSNIDAMAYYGEDGAALSQRPKAPRKERYDEPSAFGTESGGLQIPTMFAGGESPEPPESPASIYLDEIHKAASEKNYKALLQSDIAAYNLKLRSQKYLNNMLAAQGLGTQGYGSSAHVGVENNAANLYAQNLENYSEAEAGAYSEALARREAAERERDNQLVAYISESDGSDGSIAKHMANYGYVKDDDGRWVNAETGEPAPSYILSAIEYSKGNRSTTYATTAATAAAAKEAAIDDNGRIKNEAEYAKYTYNALLDEKYIVTSSGGSFFPLTIGSDKYDESKAYFLVANKASDSMNADLNNITGGNVKVGKLIIYNGNLFVSNGDGTWRMFYDGSSRVSDAIADLKKILEERH